ncbi:MAG: AAA family ATPase [Proteobacteria bacterium]|nr:AAA family ATPase [Pseudomonadota bacterium]
MTSFPEYIHLEKVYDFPQSTIYRAQRKLDNRPVIIKLYKKEHSSKQLSNIRKQIDLAQKLEMPGVKKIVDSPVVRNKLTIVLEDNGDMFLPVVQLDKPLSLPAFLEYAVNITRSLGIIHSKHAIHNDVRPQNIIVNERTGEIFFTGLSVRKIPLKTAKEKSPKDLGEDLYTYTSPEQTGRINWQVDQRSDLYSLGVVFYEMLSGKVPFDSSEPRKRIHDHLVTEPASLLTIRPDLPDIVDQIVIKLLSKSADDRYQSVFGLLQDLETCRQQNTAEHRIRPFELAKKDNIERFHIPSKLYGAQTNIVTLIESFNRVCTGSVEMLIVKGRAGMGKTSLVRELMELVHQKHGFLAQGRCEKQHRDTPYYSLIRAFQSLVRQIMSDDKDNSQKWKEKFLDGFTRNGQLVIDFIPEMEAIIGPQPKVPQIDPDEAQNRLNFIFRKFLQTFTQEGNPLVIFLDSFHWADSATIQLMQAFLSDISSRYILLVIAYQENLVIHSHTLSITLDEILKSGTHIQEISVNPLNFDDIRLLIEEALSFKQDFHALAQHVLDKTEGNPYFVKQLLQTYHEKKLIAFDSGIGQWKWNLDKIEKAEIPEDSIELMTHKIKSLPTETVEVMKLASCIGTQFDLKVLAMASEKDEEELVRLLEKPLEAGLIQPIRREWRYPNNISNPDEQSDLNGLTTYQFTHSRVLRATYSMLKEEEKGENHLMLGRLLQKNIPKEQLDRNMYKIVNQMNQGMHLIDSQSERHELARLNLIAGKKSKSAAAFETAWKYFSLGSDLLSENSWEKNYDLTKELYLRRSECDYFIGNAEAAEPVFDLLLKHIKTNREKVEVININLNLYIKNNRLEQAVEIGLEALRHLFKEHVPPNDAEINIVSQVMMQDIQIDLDKNRITNLLFLPLMTDVDKKAMLELITGIIPAAYIIRKNLWVLLTLKMVEISLRYGNSDVSAYGYMNYAVILCSGLQDYNSGHAMGRLALDLNGKFNNVSLISQLNLLFGSYINHWEEKAVDNLTYLKRSYQAGIEHGDFLSAGSSIVFLMKSHIIVGTPLEEIQKDGKKYQDFVDQLNDPNLENVLQISKLIQLLRASQSGADRFLPDRKQSQSLLNLLKRNRDNLPLQWYYLINAQIHYFFYEYSEALKLIQESDKLIASYSQLAVPEHYFYYSLIILENYNGFNEEEKKRNWDILKNNHQKLINLANDCPINFTDKNLLIAALMAGVSGNFVKATDLFDEAIKAAVENGFVHNEAVGNELAAKYYLSKNKTTIATAYIREACHAYIRWGATAKVMHLESSYPTLLKKRRRFDDAEEPDDQQKRISSFFNLESIVKASHTISGEMILDKIVEKLLKMLLDNTSAHKGYFLIEKERQLEILAEGLKERDPQITMCSTPLEEFPHIAHSVIFYVIRTRKLIALDDASKDGMFAYNTYIRETKPKSILCIPVINHGKLTGIIYLENNTNTKAFSPKQVELLTLLISQVSISIENSMLYSNLAKITEQLSSSKTKLEKRIQILEQELADNFL